MLFDDDQCFSPLSPSCEETLDDLLSPPSSESYEASMCSDAGRRCRVADDEDDDDNDDETATGDEVNLPKKKRIRSSRGKLHRRNSADATTGKAKHPGTVGRRNERERNRVKQVNLGFDRLRQYVRLPGLVGVKKKLSKVDTLRAAVDYISHLKCLLTLADNAATSSMPIQTSAEAVRENAATDGVGIANQLSSLNQVDSTTDQRLHADQDVEYLQQVQEQTIFDQQQQQQQQQPYLSNPLLQSPHRSQPTLYLNIEGLSEASIQLLMRHSPHQFPQQQQQQQPSTMSHVQRVPLETVASSDNLRPVILDDDLPRCGSAGIANLTTAGLATRDTADEGLFLADEIGAFHPTPFGSVDLMMTPGQEVTGLPQSPGVVASDFPTLGSMPFVDLNANYFDRNSFPAFFDGSLDHFHQPSTTEPTPSTFATSGLMTNHPLFSTAVDGCKFASDCFGDDSRRLAELKAWLMTDC